MKDYLVVDMFRLVPFAIFKYIQTLSFLSVANRINFTDQLISILLKAPLDYLPCFILYFFLFMKIVYNKGKPFFILSL